jgi:hypothetical protein
MGFGEVATAAFLHECGRTGRSRRLADRLSHFVTEVDPPVEVRDGSIGDLQDPNYVQQAVQEMIETAAPASSYPTTFGSHLRKEVTSSM